MLKNAPEGKLRCAINKGCYQYYCGNVYLGKDKKEYIRQIAQKEYNVKLRDKIEEYQMTLKKIFDLYNNKELENVYRKSHPARKEVIDPIISLPEQIIRQFNSIQYESKGFRDDDTTEYYTAKCERVRSKSEKIVADELYRYKIPYKYEMPLQLKIQNKLVTFYPDFTVLNKRTGRKFIIEHLGMMDKMSYYDNAIQKIDIYEKNNILLGRDMILFHETANSPLNVTVIQKYIEEYLC